MSAILLVSCVGVVTRPGLCPIPKETAQAAPTLCIEYDPNGWMDPQQGIKREELFAEFELLSAQLAQCAPVSNEADELLKARLVDLAHTYCGIQKNLSDFHMQREYLSAVRGLWSNPDIQSCRPDKGVDISNKNNCRKGVCSSE